ncbi:hypothetical protein ACLOJK_029699 [Asimina triloba]
MPVAAYHVALAIRVSQLQQNRKPSKISPALAHGLHSQLRKMTEIDLRRIPLFSSSSASSKSFLPSSSAASRGRHTSRRRKTRKQASPAAGIPSVPGVKRNAAATLRFGFGNLDELNLPVRRLPASTEKKLSGKKRRGDVVRVSARKMAAALWHIQLMESSKSFQLRRQETPGHAGAKYNGNIRSAYSYFGLNGQLWSPFPIPHLKNDAFFKLHYHDSSMERATKWDRGCSITKDKIYRFPSPFNDNKGFSCTSVISTLQAELKQSHAHIHELETQRQSSNKKLKSLLGKVAKEKALWHRKEHEKLHAVIDDIKRDLNKEKKNCEQMEVMNKKLVADLAEAKLCAKQFLQDYDKERKVREILEDMCDELANEIAEDKAEVELLKRQSMAIREEVEEERKMLQMAEVWREERVQKKLIEAKLALEQKYSELSRLIVEVETFLISKGPTSDMVEMRKAELLEEVASSVMMKDMNDFSFRPHATSEDIVSVLEDLHSGEDNVRDIEPCHGSTTRSVFSKNEAENPDICLNKTLALRSSKGNRNGDVENSSALEIMRQGVDHYHHNFCGDVNQCVSGQPKTCNQSGSWTECAEDAGYDVTNAEINEVSGASARQSKKKASSISRFWRLYQRNNDNCKTISVEALDDRVFNGVGLEKGSGEVNIGPSLGHWSTPDSGNPHITRGMKGCIEWPRGNHKSSSKSRLSEARFENQKAQVENVLKQNTQIACLAGEIVPSHTSPMSCVDVKMGRGTF